MSWRRAGAFFAELVRGWAQETSRKLHLEEWLSCHEWNVYQHTGESTTGGDKSNFFKLVHGLKKHQFCCMISLFLAKVITVTVSAVLNLFLPILAPASTLVEYERQWYLSPWDRSMSKAWAQPGFSRYSRGYPLTLGFQVPGVHTWHCVKWSCLQHCKSIMFLVKDQAVHFCKQGLLTN